MATGLLDRVFPKAQKAVTGAGFISSSTYSPLWTGEVFGKSRDPRRVVREAQVAYTMHPWIRACENVIGQRFSTVPWHLEDEQDEEVTDTSDPQYRAILNLIERPYTPKPGDPVTNTPRTRSALWKITSRHMGLTNVAAWFLDEVESTGQTPSQILYLNPARLTPGTNPQGQLTHWTLDADDQGNGPRLELFEVILFQLDPPDTGWFGTGLVEAMSQKTELTRMVDMHTAAVLRQGGKQGGVISPKEGQLNDEQFDQLVRDVRVMNEGPDAAKRWLVLKGPIDYTRTASTPVELNLAEIAQMAKEDILAGWGVPGTQLGIALPAGLNSGGAKDVDFEVLWQNAVGPRLRAFRETVQFELLDRYKLLGMQPEMEIEEPQFDDKKPLYDQAKLAAEAGIPLTNNQRLTLIGEDPFPDDDPRGLEVWLPTTFVRVSVAADTGAESVSQEQAEAAGALIRAGFDPEASLTALGLPQIKHTGLLPITLQSDPVQAGVVDAALSGAPTPTAKAKLDRDATAKRMQADIARVLSEAAKRTASTAEKRIEHLKAHPGDAQSVFDDAAFEAEMMSVLKPYVTSIAQQASTHAHAQVHGKASLTRNVFQALLGKLLVKVGLRVKGMAQTTRDALQAAIRDGMDRGLSAAELGRLIQESTGFDELRAETIARTETGTLLNESAVGSYREFGVEKVLVYDSERDDICAEADGQQWTLDEADANPLGHPNCVRSFAPIVEFA